MACASTKSLDGVLLPMNWAKAGGTAGLYFQASSNSSLDVLARFRTHTGVTKFSLSTAPYRLVMFLWNII